MAVIEEKYLSQLRQAGLFVSKPYSPRHGCPDGVRVGKPTTTPGNSIPDYEDGWDGVRMDAPTVVLYSIGGSWFVRAQDCTPTPCIGDFENEWDTAEAAIEDIIDFYLGSPERMAAKAAYHKSVLDRIAAYDALEKQKQSHQD